MNWRSSLRWSWILAALLIVSPRVSQACSSRYVGDCQVEVFCDHGSQFSWDEVYVDKTDSSMSCNGINNIDYVLYYNRNIIKFKLTYDFQNQRIDNNNNIIIPSIQYLSLERIIELNISSGQLNETPVFEEMNMIETVNISDNYLTEAKLFNERPLNSLRVLDCSHNKIVSFDIKDIGEGAYAFGGLTHLNISFNLLESVPAETFKYLPFLQSLNLSFNNINSLNMNSFEGPFQLEKLDLSSNRIDDCAFLRQRLDYLEELYLERNQIKYLRIGEFEHMKRLTILIMNSNSIINIDNNFFKNMNLLKTLDLKNNSLDKVNKNSFEEVENFQKVDLSFNNIEVLHSNLFKGNNISSFSIKGNKIKGSIGKGVFEGICMVSELDLSNQFITEIGDYTFYMLEKLISLNISHNQIQNISNYSFRTLKKLDYLDLSYNHIVDLDFEKLDLISLKSLDLRNNFIHQLSAGVFIGLGDLQKLYLSKNQITSTVTVQHVFKPLQQVETIELSHNPLVGNINANSFSGLHSLVYLDLSYTFIDVIKHGAFFNMESLIYLNVSHSNVTELENEIFGNDTAIEILDLSYNNINKFDYVPSTLNNLKELYLNKNILTKITKSDFDGLHKISKLSISQNLIEEIELHSFDMLNELQNLDVSYNPKLMFKVSLIQNNRKLDTLRLSGTGNLIKCTDMKSLPLLELMLSSSNLSSVRTVGLSQLKNLISLDLSRNIFKTIEIDVFNNLTNLKLLDMSFNQITSIQPGSFKGNSHLKTLNISHNQITTITYGTFRGMEQLVSIDLSFNSLKALSSKQFLEIPNVKSLIVDSNKLEKIEMSNLPGLELLSLGDNHLKCEDLSKIISLYDEEEQSLTITTIKLDFNSANIDGITCYHESGADITDLSDVSEFNGNSSAIVALLSDMRNMMHTITNRRVSSNLNLSDNDQNSGSLNLLIEKINDLTMVKQDNTNSTNKLLSRILEILTVSAESSVKNFADSTKLNTSHDNLASEVNNKEFGFKYLFLNNKVIDLEDKIAAVVTHFENKIKILNETGFKSEKLFVESSKSGAESGHTTFTDICVVFIFVVLVAIILYKLYEFAIPKLLRKSQRSASTRGITENIENSNF